MKILQRKTFLKELTTVIIIYINGNTFKMHY